MSFKIYDRTLNTCNSKLQTSVKSSNICFCLACDAEARHMYCFSGGVVVVAVVVGGGGVNFLCLGHFLGNYKG